MLPYCVIVAGADRAKIYVTREPINPAAESGPYVVESEEMRIIADEKAAFGADAEAPLLRKLVADAEHTLRRVGGQSLILVASSPLLEKLRTASESVGSTGVDIVTFEGDFILSSAQDLQKALSDAGVLPDETA